MGTPQTDALRQMVTELTSHKEELLTRLIAFSNQNRELTQRAETAEKELAALKATNVVELHPEPEAQDATA